MAGLTIARGHVPFTVTAYLQQGIVLDSLFGTALDGLLAAVVRDHAKAALTAATRTLITGSLLDGGLQEAIPAPVDLPLSQCAPTADTWHWAATTAYPLTPDGHPADGDPDVHYAHTRPNERAIEQAAAVIPKSMPLASGRYRMRRLPIVVTPAAAVTWRAVGDPRRAADLLTHLVSIGRRRNTGEGTIRRWEVTAAPDGDPEQYAHCHHDNTLGRPVPPICAHSLDLPTDRTGRAGLRPPYWHPATQHPVVLPDPLREDR